MRKGIVNITPEMQGKAKSLYAQGMRKAEIAREVGISRASVTRIVGDRRLPVHPYRRMRALVMYVRLQMPQFEIATKLGVSPAFVCNALKDVAKRPRPKKDKPAPVVVLKPLKRKPGPKPKPVKEEEGPKVFAIRPAVREGTRPVLIKKGLVVHAPISEPVESVRERYLAKLANR